MLPEAFGFGTVFSNYAGELTPGRTDREEGLPFGGEIFISIMFASYEGGLLTPDGDKF